MWSVAGWTLVATVSIALTKTTVDRNREYQSGLTLAETALALWESGRTEQASIAQQACRSLDAFARIFPVAQPRAWFYRGRYASLAGQQAQAIEARQALAGRLGLPLNQLRLRAYRTRSQLEQTVMTGLIGPASGTK